MIMQPHRILAHPMIGLAILSVAVGPIPLASAQAYRARTTSVSTVSRGNYSASSVNRSVTTVNRNVNVNRNINVNRNVDVNVHGGYVGYGGCCYRPPVAAVATTAAVTAAVIGATVYALPPNCGTVVVNGFAYRQCGNSWYQPQISGSSTTYVVIAPPR
jgi:hypothetical protein